MPSKFQTLVLSSLVLGTACDAEDDREITHRDAVIPTVFFSMSDDADVGAETPPDAPIYKRTPEGSVPVLSPEGDALSWGEFRTAKGEVRLTCDGSGTRVSIDASGLQPGGVYTGWLVFFDAPGFMEGGLATMSALSAAGPSDGSSARFDADGDGNGSLDVYVEPQTAGLAMRHDVEIPDCLLDVGEVHVVLAYHFDNQVCGDNPCAPDTVAEHLGWIVIDGEVFKP